MKSSKLADTMTPRTFIFLYKAAQTIPKSGKHLGGTGTTSSPPLSGQQSVKDDAAAEGTEPAQKRIAPVLKPGRFIWLICERCYLLCRLSVPAMTRLLSVPATKMVFVFTM